MPPRSSGDATRRHHNREREIELATLTDERVKAAIAEEGIRLINYRDYKRLKS